MKTRYLTFTLALAAAVAAAPLYAGAKERGASSGRSGGGHSGSAMSRHSGSPRSAPSSSRHSDGWRGVLGSRSHHDRHYSGYSRYYGGWGWPYGYYGYYSDGWYPGYYGYYGWGPRAYYNVRLGNVGSLRLQVEPKDAEVYVDGGYAGQVDQFDGLFQRLHVRPGRHVLTFKCEGFKTHRMRAYVPVDGTLRIRYHMERGSSAEETSSVVGRPESDAALRESDEPEAETAAAADVEERDTEMDDDAVAPASATIEVRLEVQPVDAAVYIDGKFAGNGDDVDELGLKAGRHRIEVVRPGYSTFEKEIVVTPGQATVLKVALDKATSS
jgi:hypothetical protein